uniref:Uncharacterized protein n=1 Tax=Bos indicus x Bos taurus TaxID=30522 RepID=A0A4W2ELA3_BOBOX
RHREEKVGWRRKRKKVGNSYFPSTRFPSCWKFVDVLQVFGRTAYDHSVVVPTHSGLSGGSRRPVFSGRRSTPVFSGELLNRHGRRLHALRPVCRLRLSSSELWSWTSPFTLKFLLGHSLLSCCLLFLFNLFRISVEVEIRHDLPWVFSGDGATHAQNFPGKHPPHQTH